MGFWKKKNNNQVIMRDGSVVDVKTTETIKPSGTYKTSKKKKKEKKKENDNNNNDNGDNGEKLSAREMAQKGAKWAGKIAEAGTFGDLAAMSKGVPLGGSGSIGQGAAPEDDAIVSDYDKDYKKKKQEYGLP